MMRAPALAAATLMWALAPALTSLQDQQDVSRFRSGVAVVFFDVAVLDRAGEPVSGLRSSDFTVVEEGVQRPIVFFREALSHGSGVGATQWLRAVAPDVRTNAPDAQRVTLLVLDDATIGFKDAERSRDVGRRIVDSLGPDDLASVIYTAAQSRSQELTYDRRLLRTAVDRFTDTVLPVDLRAAYAIGTVRRAVESLLDIPEGRKTLMFVSSVQLPIDDLSKGGEKSAVVRDRLRELTQLFELARRGNVAVYTFNPAGLTVSAPGAWDRSDDVLTAMAANTGGRAVINTNQFDRQISQIEKELRAYYLLGIESHFKDGKFRRVSVHMNRADVSVRTRSGYSAPIPGPVSAASGTTPDVLSQTVSGVLPVSTIPMRLAASAFLGRGKDMSSLVITIGLRQTVPAGTGTFRGEVDVLARAFTQNGKVAASRQSTGMVTVTPSDMGEVRYEILSRLDLTPGRYMLRVGLHSPTTGQSGSVYSDVHVDDFAKEPLAMSIPVICVSPGLVSAPRDLLKDILPVIPTTQREFRRNVDTPAALVRVYRRKGPSSSQAMLTVRIVDSAEAEVHNEVQELRFEGTEPASTSDYKVTIPIQRFQPGVYLLTFEVADGDRRAKRDVRFEVR